MTIRCNLPGLGYSLPSSVQCPALALTSSHPTKHSEEYKLYVAILSIVFVLGMLWMSLVMLVAIIVSCLIGCACQQKLSKKEMLADGSQVSPTIVVHPAKKPISIMKKKPKDFDKNGKSNDEPIPIKPGKYVKVDELSEVPDETQDGVVHGSLTLGGEWPENVTRIQAINQDKKVNNTPQATEVIILPPSKPVEKAAEEQDLPRRKELSPATDRATSPESSTKVRAKSPEPKKPAKKKPVEKRPRITRSELKELKDLKFAEQERRRHRSDLSENDQDDEISMLSEESQKRSGGARSMSPPSRGQSPNVVSKV